MGIDGDTLSDTDLQGADAAVALLLDDWDAAAAALEWQYDCGIDIALAEEPIDRFESAAIEAGQRAARAATSAQTRGRPAAAEPPPEPKRIDPVAAAEQAAAAAATLEALQEALAGYEHCELKRGANKTVFADGNPRARVMIIGEAPEREEYKVGRPYVGKAGQLLDRMFAAIGLDRAAPAAEAALYITTVMPWQTLRNQLPSDEEIAMMRPFVMRHIELADPDIVVALGNVALLALTREAGISARHGQFIEVAGRKVFPMLHPKDLLRMPATKREAWADLLKLQDYLRK